MKQCTVLPGSGCGAWRCMGLGQALLGLLEPGNSSAKPYHEVVPLGTKYRWTQGWRAFPAGIDLWISGFKGTSQSDPFPRLSGSHSSTTSDFNCWDWSPFAAAAAPVSWGVPCLTPCTPHSHRQTSFLTSSTPGFPWESQMSRSIKPFISCTVTEKQLELVPPRSSPAKDSWAFIPSQSKLVQDLALPP